MSPPTGSFPALGARRRLRALAYIGNPPTVIAGWCGCTPELIEDLLTARVKTMREALHHRISRVFEERGMTRGDCGHTRRRAVAQKWASALAWDDIDMDNPRTRPDHGWHRPASRGWEEQDVAMILAGEIRVGGYLKDPLKYARMEAVRRSTRAGRTAREISDHIGCTERTVARIRRRQREASALEQVAG